MNLNWPRRKNADGSEECCCPDCGASVDAAQPQCASCGYDIVQQAKAAGGRAPGAGIA